MFTSLILGLAERLYAMSTTNKRIYNAGTKKRTYTVTEEDHENLVKLGNGNASAGIRVAIRMASGKK